VVGNEGVGDAAACDVFTGGATDAGADDSACSALGRNTSTVVNAANRVLNGGIGIIESIQESTTTYRPAQGARGSR